MRRKCASISPTIAFSSFAREILAGAMSSFSTVVGMITSLIGRPSTSTSYIERPSACWSTNDIVVLPCGSRSTRSVWTPFSASAAARLIAVVVFPTPPFWLAIVMIMAPHLSRTASRMVIPGQTVATASGNAFVQSTRALYRGC